MKTAGAPFLDREYGHNRAGMRTFERRADDLGLTDRYEYDSLYRVSRTFLEQDGAAGAVKRDLRSIAYLLDGVGNRREVREEKISTGVVAAAYAVNEMNEYVSKGAMEHEHDDNGNLLAGGAKRLAYDYKNRLVAVSDASTGAPIARYFYYPDGRRSKKVVFSREAPNVVEKETAYYYDGQRVCEERDGITGATEATYVWSPTYIDGLVQMARGGQVFYVHQNARADVVAVTDAAGNVAERRYYDDYGRAFDGAKNPAVSSAAGIPYGFQGQRLDPETGFYYFKARYYDPESGRFLQRDPVWDPLNVGNDYTLAGNGPISGLDPLGLEGDWEWHRPKTWPIFRDNPIAEPDPKTMGWFERGVRGFFRPAVGMAQGMGRMIVEINPAMWAFRGYHFLKVSVETGFTYLIDMAGYGNACKDQKKYHEFRMMWINFAEDYLVDLETGAAPVWIAKSIVEHLWGAGKSFVTGEPGAAENIGALLFEAPMAWLMVRGIKGGGKAPGRGQAGGGSTAAGEGSCGSQGSGWGSSTTIEIIRQSGKVVDAQAFEAFVEKLKGYEWDPKGTFSKSALEVGLKADMEAILHEIFEQKGSPVRPKAYNLGEFGESTVWGSTRTGLGYFVRGMEVLAVQKLGSAWFEIIGTLGKIRNAAECTPCKK